MEAKTLNWIFLLYTILALLTQFGCLMLQTRFIRRGYGKLADLSFAGNISCIPVGMYFVVQL